MNILRSHRPAFYRSLSVSLLLASSALAITPAELDTLRAKAEKGNAIAQYNLGLAYADQSSPSSYDPVQAYVWLNLAADNGATGKVLETVSATMTPAQIAEGKTLIAARHSASPVAPAPSPVSPVQDPAETTAAQAEADKKQLSTELAASWKETDRIKTALTNQLADANKRLSIAEAALANKDKEMAALQSRLDTLATPAPAPAPANTAELDALRRERDQLRDAVTTTSIELAALKAAGAKATAETADLQAKLAKTNDGLAAAQDAQRVAESEAASLKSSADKASSERLALAAQLEAANAETARLHTELDAAKTATPAESSTVAALREKLAASEKTATDTQTELAALKASTTGSLSPTGVSVLKADRDRLADSVAQLTKERDALTRQLADAKTAAAAAVTPAATPSADNTDALKASLADAQKATADTQAKLDAALRTYTLNQAEIDRLNKALANIDDERAAIADKLDAANKELATLRPQAASGAASATQAETLRTQLSDTQAKLGERTAALDQAVRDLATARQNADAATNDLAGVREQLRQTQAQAAANANEALQLKTRLALSASAPAAPSRPGSIAPTTIPTETPLVSLPVAPPAAAPAKAEPATAPAAAQPRTHVVGPGDTLSSIAKRYYGNANRWNEILKANRDVIRNPDALSLGTKLRIP
ncbi:MAG TPA: LysM peptidoglycan-binding domain-containing protein [Rariglobus sp.]|nr:LysM peptidoglycan-binding domain-containing protein [Rariglobus sp.]